MGEIWTPESKKLGEIWTPDLKRGRYEPRTGGVMSRGRYENAPFAQGSKIMMKTLLSMFEVYNHAV